MSDKLKGFVDLSIERVQKKCFLSYLPAHNGRFRYQSSGLNAVPGTVVLFQFQARIIASALFQRDEKFKAGKRGGVLHFDVASIRTFDPLDLSATRKIWPGIGKFGHVKQFLNPALYSKFKGRLTNVMSPSESVVERPATSGAAPSSEKGSRATYRRTNVRRNRLTLDSKSS